MLGTGQLPPRRTGGLWKGRWEFCMQPPAAVLCTSGLAVEAKIARAAGFSVVISAADRVRTAALVTTAAAQTNCLVSFGIAGGLAPELAAGTVIVSGEVVSEEQ